MLTPSPSSCWYVQCVQPCTESVTCVCWELHIPLLPPPWWGPCRSLHAELCQLRWKPSVKLFKPHSCPGVGREAHHGTWITGPGTDLWTPAQTEAPGGGGGWLIAGQRSRQPAAIPPLAPPHMAMGKAEWRQPVLKRWSLALRASA